jgi:tetratricopeptide (TPR) repeat protein
MAVFPPSASGPSSVPPNTSLKPARKKEAPLLAALLIGALCLLIISSLGYFVFYPQLSASYHWREANKALENNDLAKAEAHLESCARVWASDGEVHFLLARTYRRSGKTDKARAHLQLAAKQRWVPEQIKLEYLLMQAQAGYLTEATNQLQEWLKERLEDDTYIFEALIMGCLQTNNFLEANRWATIWIDQHPDDWLGRFWLGAALQGAGEYDLAKQEYQRALERNPNGSELHLRLAEVLMRPNPTEDAKIHYEAALAADPNNLVALLGLARCQHSLRSNEVARATLDRLIELDPQNFEAYSLHGQIALEEDKPEEALKFFKKAYAINPSHLITSKQLAQTLHRLMRPDEAKEAQRRAEETEQLLIRLDEITKEVLNQPKDITLRYEAGTILLKLGDHQKAVRWFVSALLIDPKHKPTKEAIKKCLRRMGDKELLELYKPVLDDQP